MRSRQTRRTDALGRLDLWRLELCGGQGDRMARRNGSDGVARRSPGVVASLVDVGFPRIHSVGGHFALEQCPATRLATTRLSASDCDGPPRDLARVLERTATAVLSRTLDPIGSCG